jgi:hypothetical protein
LQLRYHSYEFMNIVCAFTALKFTHIVRHRSETIWAQYSSLVRLHTHINSYLQMLAKQSLVSCFSLISFDVSVVYIIKLLVLLVEIAHNGP